MSESVAQHEDSPTGGEMVLPFRETTLRRQLLLDSALRWSAVVVAIAAITWGFVLMSDLALASSVVLVLVLIGWVALTTISARTSQEMPQISELIFSDPGQAEARLAAAVRRRPLVRWIRLLIYHRLAMLRHRQRRFDESAKICAALLGRELGPADDVRPHLLLMLAESHLERRELVGAYRALLALHYTRVNLAQALQRLALQVRYEVEAQLYEAAVRDLAGKVQMAELMPTTQCASVHAMLAAAAEHAAPAHVDWLWRRVQLLAEPEHYQRLRDRDFSETTVPIAGGPNGDVEQEFE